MSDLRLLLIAPACDGQDVGEAWVAHQWVKRLCDRHDATVLTYFKRGHVPLSQQLDRGRIVEWPDMPLAYRAERLNSLLKPGYLPFYVRCRRWIRDALRRGERFDIVHQVVPVAMRYPCPAAGFGMPYVVGPVGGGISDPPGFRDDASEPWYVGLRNVDQWRLRYDPWMRRTYDGAACVIGIAPYVAEALSTRRVRRFEAMSETGIASMPEPTDRRGRGGVVRLLYVGRIVRTKGLRDVIRALSLMNAGLPVRLDVVGDGFDLAFCEALASEVGVSDKVTFHGRLPREAIDEFYRAADVFVFPSYREPGGNVTQEAMSFGLPLVVADRGGPGDIVDESCSFRVHPENPEQFAAAIAEALERLVDDSELRIRMGDAGRERIASIAIWDEKVRRLEALYLDVIEREVGSTKAR